MVVGGRIIPNFTRSWLARERPGARLPRPFSRFDIAAILASIPALALWAVLPDHDVTGHALVVAGLVQSFRLARWAGDRTVRESLVLVLHVGYAFVPFGFLLLGASVLGFGPSGAGVHAWAGAVMVMTLAVMTRATRGHTGQALTADSATQAIYAAAVLSTLARVIAAAVPASAEILLPVSGLAWTAAFLGFAVTYAPALCLATQRRAPT